MGSGDLVKSMGNKCNIFVHMLFSRERDHALSEFWKGPLNIHKNLSNIIILTMIH